PPIPTLRRPPSSALLPYTTLFRSGPGDGVSARTWLLSLPLSESSAAGLGAELRRSRHHRGAGGPHGDPAGPGGDQGAARRRKAPDRKSTRLNSSHVKISYAVFCLK